MSSSLRRSIILTASTGLLLAGALSSCRHKDMYMDVDDPVKVRVVFDWSNAPDANPESMALYLYPVEGGAPLRYIFSGREGGEIRLPFGVYDAICVNADNTDWAVLDAMDDPRTASVDVSELSSVSPFSVLGDVLMMRRETTDGSTLMSLPDATWTDGEANFDARYDGTDKVLTLYPSDPICHYTVDIYEVEGIDDLESVSVMASLSNMADGVYIFSGETITKSHAIPFILQKGDTSASLHGEFLTFGENPDVSTTHHLSLYTASDSGATRASSGQGGWIIQTKDVSDQVHGAPDARHVHIVIHGAAVPHPSSGGAAGFVVNVNGWESEYHEMKM